MILFFRCRGHNVVCSRITAERGTGMLRSAHPQGLVTRACLRLRAMRPENIFLSEAHHRVNIYQLLMVQLGQLVAKARGTLCLRQRGDLKLRLEQLLRNIHGQISCYSKHNVLLEEFENCRILTVSVVTTSSAQFLPRFI